MVRQARAAPRGPADVLPAMGAHSCGLVLRIAESPVFTAG